jgi:histidinol-phosphatase
LSIIVREAGGVFTDLQGRQPGLETSSVLASNAKLHSYFLETLDGAGQAG